MIRRLRPLPGNATAVAVLEFAFAAPILLMLILGALEVGLNLYLRSVLEGAMLQAGRNSSLEVAQEGQTAIDNQVKAQVHALLPDARVTFQRSNYTTFSDVDRPEDFTDANGNGTYDNGECFTDENNNAQWDDDVGRGGLGGANDVVRYTATLNYAGVIPDFTRLGISSNRRLTASTTLRNQPFSVQTTRVKPRICG